MPPEKIKRKIMVEKPNALEKAISYSNMMNVDAFRWFQKNVETHGGSKQPYLGALPDTGRLLLRNHKRRYAPLLHNDEAIRMSAAYGSNVYLMFPTTKTDVQLTRIQLMCESTIRANLKLRSS